MTRGFLVRLALINTFKKRLRAILAIGGIALTVAVMVILFGVEIGLHRLVNSEISNSDAKDVVTVNQRNAQQVNLDDTRISKIQSISGVSEVGQSVGLVGAAVYHGINLSVPAYAVSKEYFTMSPSKIITGTTEDQPQGANLIVSSKVLDVFGMTKQQAVGRKIQLSVILTKNTSSHLTQATQTTKLQEYTIAGVIDRGELPVLYIPIEQLRQQGLDSVTQLKLRLTSPEKAPAVRENIEQMGLQTTSVQDTIDQINKLFTVIQNILFIFGVVVFVITVSGAFTIITLTLMEETRQIGFLRITGLLRRDVKVLFVVQSIILTFLGALLGVIVGSFAGTVLNGFAKVLASSESFSGDISVFVIPVQPIIMMLMLAVIIGWLVGVIPAKRAVLINPIEELRA